MKSALARRRYNPFVCDRYQKVRIKHPTDGCGGITHIFICWLGFCFLLVPEIVFLPSKWQSLRFVLYSRTQTLTIHLSRAGCAEPTRYRRSLVSLAVYLSRFRAVRCFQSALNSGREESKGAKLKHRPVCWCLHNGCTCNTLVMTNIILKNRYFTVQFRGLQTKQAKMTTSETEQKNFGQPHSIAARPQLSKRKTDVHCFLMKYLFVYRFAL